MRSWSQTLRMVISTGLKTKRLSVSINLTLYKSVKKSRDRDYAPGTASDYHPGKLSPTAPQQRRGTLTESRSQERKASTAGAVSNTRSSKTSCPHQSEPALQIASNPTRQDPFRLPMMMRPNLHHHHRQLHPLKFNHSREPTAARPSLPISQPSPRPSPPCRGATVPHLRTSRRQRDGRWWWGSSSSRNGCTRRRGNIGVSLSADKTNLPSVGKCILGADELEREERVQYGEENRVNERMDDHDLLTSLECVANRSNGSQGQFGLDASFQERCARAEAGLKEGI